MKYPINIALIVLTSLFALTSCTVVREGEVGVKRTLGKYQDKSIGQGMVTFNPLTSAVQKMSTQTENLEVELNLPSKEGLNIRAAISILYSLDGQKAAEVLRQIGLNYERSVILPVFRSAVADVSARYFAKDMHTGQRGVIEEAIREQMMTNLAGRGIIIETVLVKSIQLPVNLARSIEEKLEAEQQSLRMEFVLTQARQQADQQRIEAEGTRDAQLIIAEGLTPEILRFKAIEAFMALSQSANAKVIITGGDMPMMMNGDEVMAAPVRK
ncbi:prohibitin family protein [Neolewinella antarctica]|uniref:Regulator of protease activity HflC (Stomatin/prohibitin superfamily) n=1 Tax=Neolewinella antarctica TaxID=442734 RepID=A0ABX0XAG3_9BACT|nr:prohibitin family protein [Neolewinella antarctica]NJC26230.1 regulator of protease activity HflC (stomatin/prohibitin superfamily) [Neolewinella antarctica]